MLAMRIPCLRKVCSQVSDAFSQALCNLSKAFLADFTLSDTFLLQINTQVQSRALLRQGFGTSVPFIAVVTGYS